MRLLLDECVPKKVKFLFATAGHDCATVREAGFEGSSNGKLLAAAEFAFDVLVTIDKNIRYQQNLTARQISVLILRVPSNDISDIAPLVPLALTALASIQPGEVVEVNSAG
ncbi:MAG: DUF5615 family PIN-like protein [Actinomycetota bacterium]